MFARISYTWQLMQASWGVLKSDKRLLVFPFLSGIACLLVLASFAVPIFMAGAWHPPARDAQPIQQIAYYGTLFAYYFVNYLVITFFNAAIIACAVERLRGGEAGLAFGFREAAARLPLIVGWALLSATVGLVLRIIEDRSEKVGQFIAGLFGVAWGVASYMVVPVLVVERKGPVAALKESAQLLRKTWGDQLGGNFGFGMIALLLMLPAFAIIAFGLYAAAGLHSWPIGAAAIGIGVLYILTLSLVQSAMQSIFQAAVYLYASGNTTQIATAGPHGFPVELLRDAMSPK